MKSFSSLFASYAHKINPGGGQNESTPGHLCVRQQLPTTERGVMESMN